MSGYFLFSYFRLLLLKRLLLLLLFQGLLAVLYFNSLFLGHANPELWVVIALFEVTNVNQVLLDQLNVLKNGSWIDLRVVVCHALCQAKQFVIPLLVRAVLRPSQFAHEIIKALQ